MEAVILDGLTAGTATVVLCTSHIASPLRRMPLLRTVLACGFCTTFWCSLAVDPSPTVLATMAIANVTLMLIHWSMTTYGDDDE